MVAARLTAAGFEQVAWLVFGAAAAVAAALILWFGRGGTFSPDELTWLMQSPSFSLGDAFDPHVGHLILTTRLVYKLAFETLGTDYLTFRILAALAVVGTSALFFAFAKRRVGSLAALAPTLVLLVFGSDYLHLLLGNGFTVLLALSCGIGALLAIERETRAGDALACALLCLGVVTYTVALAFVAGVAVALLLRHDRRQRIWTVAIPLAIYAAWWLATLNADTSSESQLTLVNLLVAPAWAFQSLSAVLGDLVGLDYFSDTTSAGGVGPTLALIAVVALAVRLWRRPGPELLWGAITVALTLWTMGAIGEAIIRVPDAVRYMYPGAIGVLLVASVAAAGVRWTRAAYIAIFAIALVGAAANLNILRQQGDLMRDQASSTRAELAGIQIAAGNANPDYTPVADSGFGTPVVLAFTTVAEDEPPTGAYLEAVDRYGPVGYSPEQLRERDESLRVAADIRLVGALDLGLVPAREGDPSRTCDPAQGASGSFELPPGGQVAIETEGAGEVKLGRFADSPSVSVGALARSQPVLLRTPADDQPEPWAVSVTGPNRNRLRGSMTAIELSIVVPAFNEREALPELLEEIERSCSGLGRSWEVVVVDDGSSDGSFELLEALAADRPWLRAVRLRTNVGKSAALATGFAYSGGDVIVTIDGDGQDDPADIPALIARLEAGADLVTGWKRARRDPASRRFASRVFNRATSRFSGLELHDMNCGLKAYRGECARSLEIYGELHRFIPVLASQQGWRVAELPVNHRPRAHGRSRFGFERYVRGALDLLTVMFIGRYQHRPLHLFGGIGMALTLVGLASCST